MHIFLRHPRTSGHCCLRDKGKCDGKIGRYGRANVGLRLRVGVVGVKCQRGHHLEHEKKNILLYFSVNCDSEKKLTETDFR